MTLAEKVRNEGIEQGIQQGLLEDSPQRHRGHGEKTKKLCDLCLPRSSGRWYWGVSVVDVYQTKVPKRAVGKGLKT